MQTVSKLLIEAAQREPDLAPYYDLHRTLLELEERVGEEITATLEMADEESLHARLSQGLPLLPFAQLPLEAGRFAELATAIAQTLTDYQVTVGDSTLPADAAAWLSLAQERFEAGQAVKAPRTEPEQVTLAQMTADLALKPYLAWAAAQVMPHVDQAHWKRGHCPVCGGEPDLAYLDKETGARHLVCSRCDSEWLYGRLGCPFCGTSDHTRINYYPSADKVYRLYVCQECKRYLKTIDLRETGREVLLPVERLTTVAMDAAAQQEGYW